MDLRDGTAWCARWKKIEKPLARLPELVAHENAISKSLTGRRVFEDRMKKSPVPAKKQLPLF
jgi:hypothetical protein